MENDVVILSEVQCIKYYLSTIGMQYNRAWKFNDKIK